jgi:quinol monooxygenase YgiN
MYLRSVAKSVASLAVIFIWGIAFAPITFAADESIVVIVKVFPTPGREGELQNRYEKQLAFLRKTEPNASFRLHRSAKEPTVFLWYETYDSQAALENHLKAAMPAFRNEFGPTPEGLIARPSDSETYREIKK